MSDERARADSTVNSTLRGQPQPNGPTGPDLAALIVRPPVEPVSSRLRRIMLSPQTSLSVALLAFAGVTAIRNHLFLTTQNLLNILREGSFVYIVACTATFVLVGSGLDLSVGSVFALGSIATVYLMVHGLPVVVAIALGISLGGVVGLINGAVSVYFRIPPLITTLGMLYVARGAVNVITHGEALYPVPASFRHIGQGQAFGVPYLVYYAVVVGLLAHVILEHTRFGYAVRATGGNRDAARSAGIAINRVSLWLYVASGLSAGFAGMLLASRLASGQPSVGDAMELQVISAVIIGGTSLFGGIGSIKGTTLGALMLAVLANGLVLMGIDPYWQNIVIGFVIVIAVGLDGFRRSRLWRKPSSA